MCETLLKRTLNMSRLLLTVLLAAGCAWTQAAGAEGVWHSDEKYKGETRLVIVLKPAGGKLGGTVTLHGVTDDDNNATTMNLVIDDGTVEGDKLSFHTKAPDGSAMDWEMVVNGTSATASIVGDQDGPSSEPQRWKMKRAG